MLLEKGEVLPAPPYQQCWKGLPSVCFLGTAVAGVPDRMSSDTLQVMLWETQCQHLGEN